MLQDTHFFENLGQVLANNGKTNTIILQQISKWSLSGISQDRRSVYPRSNVIGWMIIMKFLGIPSIHKAVTGEWRSILSVGKDVLYKVRNNEMMNWRSMLLSQSKESMKGIVSESASKTDTSFIPCFIIDDTDLSKRGKHIEWIGRIFSHVSRRHELGFKSLNLAYWSGKHLLHLDFSLHAELGKNNDQGMKPKDLKARYTKNRKPNSPGACRIGELVKKKTNVAISMIRRSIKKGIKAPYILADSWFFNSELATFALKENINLISRPKFNNWKYSYQDKSYSIGALIKKLRYSKKAKYNRHLRLKFVSVSVEFKGIKFQLVYFKEKTRGTKWQTLITTDRKISAQRIFKIYQTRWTIETSYKELKQTLGLGQCMSRDFDAHISDTTQVLMTYNLLSHTKAIHDYQSIGMLFEQTSRHWLKPTQMKRFWNAFYEAIKNLAECLLKPVDELINLTINDSKFFRHMQKFNAILSTET